ncbi:TerB family tellurite resistance protein [Alphaproteobacteria bacterium]|nr:TerB family tellurite resistance protein [Alphaproteobacteria bacterium]
MTLTEQIKEIFSPGPSDDSEGNSTLVKEAIVHAMASEAKSDGTLDVSELSSIAGLYQRITGEAIEASEISTLVSENAQSNFDLVRHLQSIRSELRPKDKRRIVEATYRVAVADGGITEDEEKTLGFVAMALGMSETEFQDITRELER